MVCPICSGEHIPDDASLVEKSGRRVILQGSVYAIILPDYTYSPYLTYATVTINPRKGSVKYLKFRTQEELVKWPFERKGKYIVQGCLHIADGKELIFDITSVESVV
jgi:hypothetical protein